VKPWLAYTRVSTEDQAREGVSLDVQRQSCTAFAAAFGWQIEAVVSDPGRSAKDLDRPGIQGVLARVEAGTIAGLIVHKLDRLTRSVRDLCDLVERFDQAGVALVSVSEKLDTASPMGRFTVTLLGAVAQWERETIADRVQTAMDHRRAQGGFIGGPVPSGLRVVGDKGKRELEVDPAWGDVVRGIWPAITSGLTLRQVADQLNAAGLPTGRTGCRWQPTTVRKVALNPRYVGLLVTAAAQEEARKALASRFNPKQTGRPSHRAITHSLREWPLSGIARCGDCGGALVGVTSSNATGKAYHYYRCSARQHHGRARCSFKDIRAEPWERAVVDFLVEGAKATGLLAPRLRSYAAAAREAAGPLQARRVELQLRRDGAAAEVARLVELAATGGMAANALAKPLADRQAALEELQGILAGVEGQIAATSLSAEQAEQLLAMIQDRIARLPDEPPEEQAASIRQLVAQVTLRPIDKQKGEVDLSINLPRLLASDVFVRQCPVVVVGALRTESVSWGGAVQLRQASAPEGIC
jgi:site-specific DNA recombinase